MPQATFLTVSIPLEDLPATLALYDRIQVWRSTTGKDGIYAEITADSALASIVKSTVSPPWDVAGLTLTASLSGADPVTVTFQPLSPPGSLRIEDVVKQINEAIPGLASVDTQNNAVFDLTSPIAGTGSSILIGGTSAAVFGLPTTLHSGKGPRVPIGLLNTKYRFTDLGGDGSYWYRTRFYSTLTQAVSDFSDPRLGEVSQTLPAGAVPGLLSQAVVNLVDVTGKAIAGRRIILVPVQEQIIPYNNMNYGLLPSNDRIELTTDEAGHAEVLLVRGATVRAFFEGSGFSREFVVPNQDFDLLSVLSTEPDPFSIVQAPPIPIRES